MYEPNTILLVIIRYFLHQQFVLSMIYIKEASEGYFKTHTDKVYNDILQPPIRHKCQPGGSSVFQIIHCLLIE